jgi:hypothetical protein
MLTQNTLNCVALRTRNLSFTVLEVGKAKAPEVWCLVRAHSVSHLLAMSSNGGRDKDLFQASYKGTNPTHEGSILMT